MYIAELRHVYSWLSNQFVIFLHVGSKLFDKMCVRTIFAKAAQRAGYFGLETIIATYFDGNNLCRIAWSQANKAQFTSRVGEKKFDTRLPSENSLTSFCSIAAGKFNTGFDIF